MSKEILEAVGELGNTVLKNREATQAEVETLRREVKSLRAQGGRFSAPNDAKSFGDGLSEALMEQKANIQRLAEKPTDPRNSFDFELKAVADMTFGVNFSSANVSTATLKPGIIAAPSRRLHIRSLLPTGQMDGNHFVYIKETSHDGDPAPVLEAGNKAQMDFNLAETSTPAQTIAGWVQISNQLLYDVNSLTSFLQGRLLERLMCIEDAELLNGSGTAPHLMGINTAGNFTAAADTTNTLLIELLIEGIGQLAALNRSPSGIIISATDYYALFLNKASTSGLYNLPDVVSFNGSYFTILGVPVVWTAEQAAGTYTIGDFNAGTQLLTRNAPKIEFFVDASLAKVNKTLVRIEERVAFAVFGSDYIIKGAVAS